MHTLIYVCGRACAMTWVWWAKDNWLVLVFYFYKVCPKNQTWVVGLGKKEKAFTHWVPWRPSTFVLLKKGSLNEPRACFCHWHFPVSASPHWRSKRTCPWWFFTWLLAQFLKILKIYLHMYVCINVYIHAWGSETNFKSLIFVHLIDVGSLPSPILL